MKGVSLHTKGTNNLYHLAAHRCSFTVCDIEEPIGRLRGLTTLQLLLKTPLSGYRTIVGTPLQAPFTARPLRLRLLGSPPNHGAGRAGGAATAADKLPPLRGSCGSLHGVGMEQQRRQLYGHQAAAVARNTGLQQLALQCSSMTDRQLAAGAASLPSLRHLELSKCDALCGDTLAAFSQCRRLQHVGFTECGSINSHGLRQLLQLSSLVALKLDRCPRVVREDVAALQAAFLVKHKRQLSVTLQPSA